MAPVRDNSIGALCAGLSLFALTACAALEPPPSLAPPPDLTLRNVHMSQFRHGVLTASVTADEMLYTRDTGHLEGKHGTLFPLTGTMAGGKLTAGLTVGSTRSGAADLSSSVHWTSPGGDRAETAACAVDFVKQVVKGTEPIQLDGTGYTINAQAFESRYGASSEIHLAGGVHLRATDEVEGQPQ
jgi:hypothetical protein